MRKGRGFRLKGFSTGNGKTSKPLVTGRQFGSKFDSPLLYNGNGNGDNDEEARDRADDIAHGDGVSAPVNPPVDAGMPAVDEQPELTYQDHLDAMNKKYANPEKKWENWGTKSHNITSEDLPGSEDFDQVHGKDFASLTDREKMLIYERRNKPGYSPAHDASHEKSYYNPNAPYLTKAERDVNRHQYGGEFSVNLKTSGDRSKYNKFAQTHAIQSDAWKNTGMASYTTFNPQTGKRQTVNIRDPKFKPNNEQKVSLDAKQVQSVSAQTKPTLKPTRSTQTKPTGTKTKPTGSKKSTSYSDAYKKRDKKIYGNLSEAEYTAEAKRQKAMHKKTGKWDAPKEAMKSKEKKK